MRKEERTRRSPAIALTAIALVAALSGAAIADPGAGTSGSAKKTAKKALKKAKSAKKQAKAAEQQAQGAEQSAESAQQTADTAAGTSAVASVQAGPALSAGGTKVAEVTLTTVKQSRILASATSVIGNDVDDAVICWLNAGGAPNNVDNDISQRAFSDTGDGVFDFEELSVNGSVVKPAGTHTVTLYCGISAGDPIIDRIDLIAWTTAV